MTNDSPDPQQPRSVYWELRNDESQVTAAGFSKSINQALLDAGAKCLGSNMGKNNEVVVIPPGMYIDGSPQLARTAIVGDQSLQSEENQ